MPSGPLQFIAQMRAALAKGGKEAMQGTIGMGGRVACLYPAQAKALYTAATIGTLDEIKLLICG